MSTENDPWFGLSRDMILVQIRNRAKRIRKRDGIRHAEALQKCALYLGYNNWNHLFHERRRKGDES